MKFSSRDRTEVELAIINKKLKSYDDKPFDKRSTLSNRPSTVDRNESKFANGAAKPWSTLRDLLLCEWTKKEKKRRKKNNKLLLFMFSCN